VRHAANLAAGGTERGGAATIWMMSEHTERLEDLTKRIASAKEFL
jgi:hypothetical protein